MPISKVLHVKCPSYKRSKIKRNRLFFFVWNFHMVFKEQIAVSYQYFCSQGSIIFFNVFNLQGWHWNANLCPCTIQYNTMQYNTIQYNTIQYNIIQYNTIQYNTILYYTILYPIQWRSIASWGLVHSHRRWRLNDKDELPPPASNRKQIGMSRTDRLPPPCKLSVIRNKWLYLMWFHSPEV